MPLCTPSLCGPLTSWSRTLLIEGALPGATIHVREGSPIGSPIAEAVVAGGRDRIDLLPGVTLSPGRQLVVAQELGEEISNWTQPNLAEFVGWPPVDWAKVPAPWFRSRLHCCGRALWLSGCVPGAELTVASGGVSHGYGPANEGEARIRLDDPFPANGGAITAAQAAPVGAPAPTGALVPAPATLHPLPVPGGTALPPPIVGEPMPMGCDSAVVIRGVVDGAEVTIARVAEGIVETTLFDLDSLTVILGSPLDPGGGRIDVTQSVAMRCEVQASPARVVGFGPVVKPPTPSPKPPCGGSAFLWITDLKPGAEVAIDVAGTVYRTMVSPGATEQLFELEPMDQGDAISVVQTACGVDSDAGTTEVRPAEAAGPPKLAGPLLECARIVRVVGVVPGALVRIVAKGPSGGSAISPFKWSAATSIGIEVSPSLIEGQEIYAEQVACGGPAMFSDPPLPVGDLPPPQPVEIAFAFATQRSVTVVALPGSLVRIFTRRDGVEEIGWGLVDPENDRVWVKRPLVEGEYLFAVQEICAMTSTEGPAYAVKPGERVFELAPAKRWPVTSEAHGHDVTWLEGKLVCRISGDYHFFCKFQNKAEKSTADIDATVKLTHPAGLSWGTHVVMLLAADDKDDPTNKVILAKGFKAEDEDTLTGLQPQWRQPAQWIRVLNAMASFDWIVATWTFPEIEADDAEEEKADGPKPPPSS